MGIRALLFLLFFAPTAVFADVCNANDWRASLRVLRSPSADEDERGVQGACLIRAHLGHLEVANAVVMLLKKDDTPLFLKEDLVEALAHTKFRRTLAIRETLTTGPISPEDKAAVGPTVASASTLLTGAEGVKTQKEVFPVTSRETEIVRALSEIVINDENHVILRGLAVKALANISGEMRESGVFNDNVLHVAFESMRYASLMPGEATYFIGAADAYNQVSDVHERILAGIRGKGSRGLASEKKK